MSAHAGHTPAEWTMCALARPPAGERVSRLIELADTTARLLAGEKVTHRGDHIDLVEARLASPRPVRGTVPLLIGGGNHRLLEYALAHADIVATTGLGATLDDGHRHQVRCGATDLARLRRRLGASHCDGASPADVLAAPFTLIGTEEDLVAEIRHHGWKMGVTSFCVPAASMDDLTPVIDALTTRTR